MFVSVFLFLDDDDDFSATSITYYYEWVSLLASPIYRKTITLVHVIIQLSS